MEKFFRIFFVSVISILLVSGIMYASSTIISVETQSIAQGDVIANGWFQEVNDSIVSIRNTLTSNTGNLWGKSGNDIYYTGGNVGIGTSTPGSKLEVNGNSIISVNGATFLKNTSAGAIHAIFNYYFPGQSDNGTFYFGAGRDSDNSRNGITLYNYGCSPDTVGGTNYNCNVPQINLLADNTSASNNFTVGGSLLIGNWRLENTWPNYTPGFMYNGGNIDFGIHSALGQASLSIDGGFRQRESGTVNYFMDSVGIGTTSPGQKLSVAGTIESTSGGYKFPDGTVQTTASAGSSIPAGAIMAFNLSTCPTGWIAANGTSGTPDLRGEFIRGLDNGRGVDSGRSLGSWQVDMFKSHNHQIWGMVYDNNIDGADSTTRYSFENHYEWVTSTSVGGTETRPRNIALLYCQKQ